MNSNHTPTLDAVYSALYSLDPRPSDTEIQDIVSCLAALLQDGGIIDEYFDDCIGTGSFKEAYRCGDIVIKFAEANETTEREVAAYNQAADFGIDYLFAPTHFIPIPANTRCTLSQLGRRTIYKGHPDWNAEDADTYGRCYKPTLAAYIVIQPLVTLDRRQYYCTAKHHYTTPLKLRNGTEISYEAHRKIDAPLQWQQSVIDTYGDAAYYELQAGVIALNMGDLSANNVGWLRDLPVMFDWLSYES